MAFSPDATESLTGRLIVRAESYTMTAGSTASSTPVVFRARVVRPQTLVASEPA